MRDIVFDGCYETFALVDLDRFEFEAFLVGKYQPDLIVELSLFKGHICNIGDMYFTDDLVYDGYFVSDLLFQLKSGKEATVFCCSAQSHNT